MRYSVYVMDTPTVRKMRLNLGARSTLQARNSGVIQMELPREKAVTEMVEEIVREARRKGRRDEALRDGDTLVVVPFFLIFGPKPVSHLKPHVILVARGGPGWELDEDETVAVEEARGRGDEDER